MFAELRVFALYGPGTALSFRAKRSGTFTYSLQGNVEPLFPTPEMGFYSGADAAHVEAIFGEADAALPGASSNPRPAPDAAFVSVKSDAGSDWVFDLYDIPATARPFLDAVFQFVEGPGRAWRARAVTATAALSAASAGEFRPVGCAVSLRNPAPQRAAISSPRGETFELVLADASPSPDPERYTVFTGDELRVTGAPTGATSSMPPGSQLDVVVETARGLDRGTYRGTLTYRSLGADLGASGGLGLAGALRLDLGVVLVTP